jgi:addiction module HigA family antidote
VGEILLEEFLKSMELSQNALPLAAEVPPRRITEIVLGKRAVTADTDLRLTRYFGLCGRVSPFPARDGRSWRAANLLALTWGFHQSSHRVSSIV